MILSMTGLGRAELRSGDWLARAELRTLNNRFLDLNLKLSPLLRSRELELRTLLAERLQRGKAEALIVLTSDQASAPLINQQVVLAYAHQLQPLMKKFKMKKSALLPLLLQLPDVMQTSYAEPGEEQWNLVQKTVLQAVDQLQDYRRKEGKHLEHVFREQINRLLQFLANVQPLEEERRTQLRNRLTGQLTQWHNDAGYDAGRLEQELIYYLERMDFTEEKVRLTAHCNFFLQCLQERESNGRRLGFIAQELGREINTLGAKAYHAGIQQLVVHMKEELEKIKEQLQNVL